MASDERAVSRLHYEMIRGLLDHGGCPVALDLARAMGTTEAAIEDLLRALSDIHGVVLQPHVCEPWVIHPFSLTPTIHWVVGKRGGWWAPCIWCALGVAELAEGDVRIHTRWGGEGEPLIIRVRDGMPVGMDEVVVHFAIPPAQAWQNVHRHCALVLPFRSEEEIAAWCERHRHPRGQAVPLPQVARFAQRWYGSHANPDWHKWTVEEAQEIFQGAGLRGEFWDLGARGGRY